MKAHVVGFQSCDFKDREGKQVQGVSLKCVVDSTNVNLVGKDICKIWLSNILVSNVGFIPEVDKDVNLIYDFDGRHSVLIGYEQL